MDDRQFQQLEQRIAAGEELTTVDQFLFEREQQRREVGPNPLQRQNAARQENALLKSPPLPMRMGAAADRRDARAQA